LLYSDALDAMAVYTVHMDQAPEVTNTCDRVRTAIPTHNIPTTWYLLAKLYRYMLGLGLVNFYHNGYG